MVFLGCFFILFVLVGTHAQYQYCVWPAPSQTPSPYDTYQDLLYVPCDEEVPCINVKLFPIGTTDYPRDPCTSSVYCRIDPGTQQLCLNGTKNSAGEKCFNPNQIIAYPYDSDDTGFYDLILGSGTCEEQLSISERASYYSTCDNGLDLHVVQEGYGPDKINLFEYGCLYSTGCGDDYYAVFDISLGSTIGVGINNGSAIAVKYLGDEVCFSWKQVTVDFKNDDNQYSYECKTECSPWSSSFSYSIDIIRLYALNYYEAESYLFTLSSTAPSSTTSSSLSPSTSSSGSFSSTTSTTSPSEVVSLPYCATIWNPSCPGSCPSYYSETALPCTDTDPCQNITLDNVVVSSTFGSSPCLTIEDFGDYYCRIDPISQELCLVFDDGAVQSQRCYRQHQLIENNFYFYPSIISPVIKYLLMISGTCTNLTLETEMERAAHHDLCNDAALKQPEDGDIESVTVAKAMCNTAYYQSWCDDGPRNIYTLQRGVVLHTEVINGDAFGMLLTGKSVCFSWDKKTTSILSGFPTNYDYTCMEDCQEITTHSTTFTAQYDYVSSNFDDPFSTSYEFTITRNAKGTTGGGGHETTGGSSSGKKSSSSVLVPGVSLVLFLVVYLLV